LWTMNLEVAAGNYKHAFYCICGELIVNG